MSIPYTYNQKGKIDYIHMPRFYDYTIGPSHACKDTVGYNRSKCCFQRETPIIYGGVHVTKYHCHFRYMFSQLRRSVTVTVYILLQDIKKPTQLHKVKVVDFLFVQDWRRGENKDACAV